MTAFDNGFELTKKWLDTGCVGNRPVPTDVEEEIDCLREEWHEGAVAAFEFVDLMKTLRKDRADMFEDLFILLLALVATLFAVSISFSGWFGLCVAALILYFSVPILVREFPFKKEQSK